jgi:hypothetical protein
VEGNQAVRNAVFFLRLSIVGLLAYGLWALWEWAEIALYGIHQLSVVDAVAAVFVAVVLERWIWRLFNG